MRWLILFLLLTSTFFSQQYLNLDFEQQTTNAEPRIWFPLNNAMDQFYEVTIDSTTYYSGSKSLRVDQVSSTESPIFVMSRLRNEDVIDKQVKITGYIKTDDIVNGHAEIWIQNFSMTNPTIYEIQGWGPDGTTGWTQYSTEISIDSTAEKILFGIVLKCSGGTAWFDNFQIEIDGIEYKQELFIPTQDQINWIIDNAIPFNSVEPTSDYSDLLPLKSMIGDSKIVALGEATHGTSEFFKMKHKLVKFLAEEMGFSVFAFEDMMPVCRNICDYVLNGEGNPIKLLDKMHYVWDTQEVLDIIMWMQEYNMNENNNLEFWGFDMQYPYTSADSVKSFVEKADPDNAASLVEACDKVVGNYRIKNWIVMKESADYVHNHLLLNQETYLRTFDTLEVKWAIKYAEIMVSSAEYASKYLEEKSNYRDAKMALNIEWILEHLPPDTKMVLWAHNIHVSKNSMDVNFNFISPMGKLLKNKYLDNYISIGFGFHDGTYRASNNNHLSYQAFKAFPSTEGGIEWAFHKTNIPNLYLDLSKVSAEDTNSNWLNNHLEIHNIGWRAEDHQLLPVKLTDMFDAFVYVDETTAAKGDPIPPSDVKLFNKSVPSDYQLSQNYPNPFNPSTIIKYSIPHYNVGTENLPSVQLKIFDILGREVATLVNQKQNPGNYEVTWEASIHPSGVYFYQLKTNDFVETKKMILLR